LTGHLAHGEVPRAAYIPFSCTHHGHDREAVSEIGTELYELLGILDRADDDFEL
jgi:hypothetical protein